MLQIEPDQALLVNSIAKLISKRKLSAVFAKTATNIHIKRFDDESVRDQLKLLKSETLDSFCLYPTARQVQNTIDVSSWNNRPFSQRLLLTEPQLTIQSFEMAALERYVSDPRYNVEFNDYMGRMSVSTEYYQNERFPERDKVSLQSFGLGLDKKYTPYVVVYLRYLSNLSSEHQHHWNGFLVQEDVKMCKQYYMSSIEGNFWENRSVRFAILEEMRLIRELSAAIWGKSLFREPKEAEIPISLTSFLRPTAENFNRLVMALDKLLSESIDPTFFEGKCDFEFEEKRPDGKIVVRRKGTIAVLEEWLLSEVKWEHPEAFKNVVIKPLRDVRRLRQTPAHSFTSDSYSIEYYEKRRRLLWHILNSLSNIRLTFSLHPNSCEIELPDWLDNSNLDVF